MIFHHHSITVLKGRVRLPNRMNFRKSAKGGGGHFQSKIYIVDFGNLRQGFLSMKLMSNIRVQGMFFQQLYRYELILTDTIWRGE